MRADRVNEQQSQNSQTHNSHGTLARSLHDVHVARCVQNSSNSLGDEIVRGRGVCVPGATKSLSTSTRSAVRRSTVYESAHTQQKPLKMHVETWAGLQLPKIFPKVEIVAGCAVAVACPSCPDYAPEPPGQGRIIRNMLGWSQLVKTIRSGVWLFRGAFKKRICFFPCRCWRLGKEGDVPHSVGGPLRFLMHLFVCVRARPRYRATYWRPVFVTASRCVEGYRTPDEALVC